MTNSSQTVPVPVDLLKRLFDNTTLTRDAFYGDSVDVQPSGIGALIDIKALIPAPPKVGDTIDAAEQIADLPDHSVLIDTDGEPWTVVGGEPLYYVDGKREGRSLLVCTYGPLTLVHLGTTGD